MNEKTDVFAKAKEARHQTRAAARSMAELARLLTLAGIGAAALAKDETEHLAQSLIERGALARGEARRVAGQALARGQERGYRTHGLFERQVESVLQRMNVPTHADLKTVNDKIDALNTKLDAALAPDDQDALAPNIDPATMI